jgi:N-carbamoylputrescine amidase
MESGARTLLVAAVQMESKNGQIEGNLEHAESFVDDIAQKGARLILLPEFLATGYIFTKAIWDVGEPKEGSTVKWLRENSKRLGVWLGASFLEADGEDFYNTFVLTNPDGREDGRVRKQTPAFAEAYFTKGDPGPHIIRTELGKIGVGICYENQLAYTPQLMHAQSVDLMLMPHSAPAPMPNPLFPRKSVDMYNEGLKGLASHYARLLGIPVIMVNKCGRWRSPVPFLPFITQDSSFPGLSTIVDSDGITKARLSDEEGVIVAEVTLDPARKTGARPVCHGRWSTKEPAAMNLFRLVEAAGRTWYRFSGERRRRAREISSGE